MDRQEKPRLAARLFCSQMMGEAADQLTVSLTALAVDLTSLPTPRMVLAQAVSASAQARMAIGAMRSSFMNGVSLDRY
jgi:hypothetical protein